MVKTIRFLSRNQRKVFGNNWSKLKSGINMRISRLVEYSGSSRGIDVGCLGYCTSNNKAEHLLHWKGCKKI